MSASIVSKNPAFGWNPISRRYIKRNGAVYKRLVFSGVVVDPEINAILQNPATGTPRRAPDRVATVAPPPTIDDRAAVADSKRSATRIRSQLDDLAPDELEAIMRGVHAMRAASQPRAAPSPARWRAAPAARTETETETDYAPESSARDSSESGDEQEAPTAPIRIPRQVIHRPTAAPPSRIRRR